MLHSSTSFHDRQLGRDVQASQSAAKMADPTLAETLKRIVRRILRTQSCRTHFEARVLDEARRLLKNQFCEMARDTLERLVVDQLLCDRHEGRVELAGPGIGTLCPSTQVSMSHSTFARHAGADASRRRKE